MCFAVIFEQSASIMMMAIKINFLIAATTVVTLCEYVNDLTPSFDSANAFCDLQRRGKKLACIILVLLYPYYCIRCDVAGLSTLCKQNSIQALDGRVNYCHSCRGE